MALLCRRIPRKQLQEVYRTCVFAWRVLCACINPGFVLAAIELPTPRLGEDPNRNPTHREFLDVRVLETWRVVPFFCSPDHSLRVRSCRHTACGAGSWGRRTRALTTPERPALC